MAKLSKVVSVPMYSIPNMEYLGEEEIAGAVTSARNLRFLVGYIPQENPKDPTYFSLEWIENGLAEILAEAGVERVFPPHPDWFNIRTGEFRILTADDAPLLDWKSGITSRSQLLYHLDPGKSQNLGWYKTRIVHGGSIELCDGYMYARPGILPLSGHLWKVIGYKDPSRLWVNPEVVAKGMIEITTPEQWETLVHEYNLSGDVEIIVPEITCKFLKDEVELPMEFHTVFEGRVKYEANYSLKLFKTLPLSEKGYNLGVAVFGGYLEKVFEAFASKDRTKVLGIFRQIVELSDGVTEAELEEFQSIDWKLTCLALSDEELVNKLLPILLRAAKRRPMEEGLGVSSTASPGMNLGEREIRISEKILRYLGKAIGDTVTMTKPPFTGIEAADVKIVGICRFGIQVNPVFFRDRFAGDFDGDDIYIIGLDGLVKESSIGNMMTIKNKNGNKREFTVLQAAARAWFSKTLIPLMDSIIISKIEEGVDISEARDILQRVIDMVKHDVDLPSYTSKGLTHALCGTVGTSIPTIHRIFNLYRSDERERMARYNHLVGIIAGELSNIPFMRELGLRMKYILGEVFRIETPYFQDSYGRICKNFGLSYLVQGGNFTAPIYDADIVASKQKWAVQRYQELRNSYPDGRVVKTANAMFAVYRKMVSHFRDRENGGAEKAYKLLEDLRERIAISDPILVGNAVEYIFLGIVHKKRLFRQKGTGYGWYLTPMAYLPAKIGNWDLKLMVDSYGGIPPMSLHVLDMQVGNKPEPDPDPDRGSGSKNNKNNKNKMDGNIMNSKMTEVGKILKEKAPNGAMISHVNGKYIDVWRKDNNNIISVSRDKLTVKTPEMGIVRAWEYARDSAEEVNNVPKWYIIYNHADKMDINRPGVSGLLKRFKGETEDLQVVYINLATWEPKSNKPVN